MTSDHDPPGFGESQDAADQPMAQEESASGAAETMFSSGEGMVALGGIVVLLAWLIFEVFTDDYSIATLAIVLAAVAAILPRLNRDAVEKVASLSVLMKVTGYLLAITGVTEIILDIDIGTFGDGASKVIAALAAYAGYVLAFLGAQSIET